MTHELKSTTLKHTEVVQNRIPAHPSFEALETEYQKMLDTFAGEASVKAATTTYLPATKGQLADGYPNVDPGKAAYNSYRDRSIFSSYVQDAVISYLGSLHLKPPVIEVPSTLNGMLEEATNSGDSIWSLLRQTNTGQLKLGRFCLLVDMDPISPAGKLPFIAPYSGAALRNWDTDSHDNFTFVVLDESFWERRGFEWKWVSHQRILQLNEDTGLYEVGCIRNGKQEGEFITPTFQGKPLSFIPFTVINTTNLSSEPTLPPLLGLANEAIHQYKLNADYFQQIYMQGMATLVRTGASEEQKNKENRFGPGTLQDLPAGATLAFVEVGGTGLAETRKAVENSTSRLNQLSAQLTDKGAAESGEALKLRQASAHTSLVSIAETAAEGLKIALQHAAIMVGANPEDVIFEPNLDFTTVKEKPAELKSLVEAKNLGAPLSKKSMHAWLLQSDLTLMSYEEELEQIEKEQEIQEVEFINTAEQNIVSEDEEE